MEKRNATYEKVRITKDHTVNIHKFCFTEEQDRIRQRHWHRSLEITYHENADGRIFLDGKEQKINGNTLILINSRCVHEIHNHVTPGSSSLVLIIPYDFLKKEIASYDHVYFTVGEHDETIISLLNELYECSLSEDPYHSLHLQSLLYALLHYLCSHCLHFRDTAAAALDSKQDWVLEVTQYLNDNYDFIQKMSDVSVHFGYTEEAFCRKFRQMFHCTLHQFLTRLRIQKAAGKIRMTSVGYANIAVTCGFPSLRSMNHYMKSLTGFSPAEIRALSERDYQDLLESL